METIRSVLKSPKSRSRPSSEEGKRSQGDQDLDFIALAPNKSIMEKSPLQANPTSEKIPQLSQVVQPTGITTFQNPGSLGAAPKQVRAASQSIEVPGEKENIGNPTDLRHIPFSMTLQKQVEHKDQTHNLLLPNTRVQSKQAAQIHSWEKKKHQDPDWIWSDHSKRDLPEPPSRGFGLDFENRKADHGYYELENSNTREGRKAKRDDRYYEYYKTSSYGDDYRSSY